MELQTPAQNLARILIQSSVDGLFAIDREERYTLWNHAMEMFAGKTSDEVLGRNLFEVFPFLRDLGLDQAVQQAFAGQAVTLEAVPNSLPDGTTHYFDRHYLPLRDDAGVVVGMVGVVRDVTARRNAEHALRSSEAKLRAAVTAGGVGLWSWDVERDEVLWENELSAIFGLAAGVAPATREAYLALLHPEDRETTAKTIATGLAHGKWESEHRIVRPDSTVRWILSKCTVAHHDGRTMVQGAIIDISERRERDEQLRQVQKLQAVGELTAGIAHNFNNILMALLPNIELAAQTATAEQAPLLASAEQAATRAAVIVRELMTFAGRNRPTAHTVESIALLAERTVTFCCTTFDRRIKVEGTYAADTLANVDASQVEQVVANLIINARDALSDETIEAPHLGVDVDRVRAGAEALGSRHGDFVRIRVTDNGAGMSAATVARIFEPFFTTKDIGKGTGLGLATTHAIVNEHGGFITTESALRKGTTMSVYLPSTNARPADAEADKKPAPKGTETILIVDDEASIRKVVGLTLRTSGYAAHELEDGESALEFLSDPKTADVALVLLDLSMPGLSGRALIRRIRAIAPRTRIVLFTGYARNAVDDGPDAPDEILLKPTKTDVLLETIRAVLDRPAPK